MPYIKQEQRKEIQPLAEKLAGLCDTPGKFNFAVSTMLLKLLSFDMSYDVLNGFIGVLECIKLELYRRVVSPYEDQKIGINGDIEVER
jgi:hypothetical protein